MPDIFNIAGRIHSTSNEKVAVTADEILDITKNLKQDEINAATDTALDNRYTKSETYSKTELDNMISPELSYAAVDSHSSLPASGTAGTIYRVGSWDGAYNNGEGRTDASKYSEYAWDGDNYVLLAVKSYGIDDIPTSSSSNMVKSGGVADVIGHYTYLTPANIVEGYTINGYSGGDIASENANYAIFPVHEGYKYKPLFGGKVSTKNYCRIAFYSSVTLNNNTFIDGTNTQSPKEYFTVPENAVSMKICILDTGYTSYNLIYEKSLIVEFENTHLDINAEEERATNEEAVINGNMDYGIGKFSALTSSTIISPCAINASGKLRDNVDNSFKVTRFDISDYTGSYITIETNVLNNSLYAYSITNGDLDTSGTTVLLHANETTNVKKKYQLIIPEGAVYLYLQNPKENPSTFKMDGVLPTVINNRIDDLEGKLIGEEVYAEDITGTQLEGYNHIRRTGRIQSDERTWRVTKYDVEDLLGIIHLYSVASSNSTVSSYALHDASGNVLDVSENPVSVEREYYVDLSKFETVKWLYVTNPEYVKCESIGIVNILTKDVIQLSVSNKVYTETNNILWLGTSIPEGSTYPIYSAKKCGYNCTNKGYGSSFMRWPTSKPTSVTSNSGKCLTATVQELEDRFREDVTAGRITETTLNTWKSHCYERAIIPYIDGTNATQVSMIVIDHGYNDRSYIHTQINNGIENIDWTSKDRSNFVGAFNYLLSKIQEVNPFVKIVIAGYFTNTVDYAPSKYTHDICYMQELIAEHYGISIMKAWEHTQINGSYVAGTSNYIENFNQTYGTNHDKINPDSDGNIMAMQLYCPDFIHPHTDLTGNCNRRLNAVYAKLLRDLI